MVIEATATVKRKRIRTLEYKHPLAIRWFHWINFPVLFLMIWSGLMIYWANRVFHVRLFGHDLAYLFPDKVFSPQAPAWWPQWLNWTLTPGADESGKPVMYLWNLSFRLAEGMSWHFTIAWLFAINGLAYVLYLVFSGAWRQLLPKPAAFKEAILVVLHDLYLYRKPLPVRKYNAAQQIAYTGVIILGFLMLVTGLAIYKPAQQSWLTLHLLGGYTVARFIHFWVTMTFCLFFLVHVGQVAKTGWNNFRAMVTGYELVDTGAEE